MEFSPLLKKLIEALRVLPGIGPKSAQRMAFYLLERDREGGVHLAKLLQQAMQEVGQCQCCRILCEHSLCLLCSNTNRDESRLCVVQSPADVMALEQAGGFDGYYFVLSGHLSPIDGIGPVEIGIPELENRVVNYPVQEIILATNATVEGEATAYYIAQWVNSKGLSATRIAQGIPLGGELEYLDGATLARALFERTKF